MTNTRELLIDWWSDYFYEVFIPFVFGCPELKPSRVTCSNTTIVTISQRTNSLAYIKMFKETAKKLNKSDMI